MRRYRGYWPGCPTPRSAGLQKNHYRGRGPPAGSLRGARGVSRARRCPPRLAGKSESEVLSARPPSQAPTIALRAQGSTARLHVIQAAWITWALSTRCARDLVPTSGYGPSPRRAAKPSWANLPERELRRLRPLAGP